MISVVVSAISIVVIITVTVVLVTSNQKAHSEQKSQLRKVISDVNSMNNTTAEVDRQQNNSILSLNSNVMLARTTANNLRTFVDSSFSNLAREVRSDLGTFNTLNTTSFVMNRVPIEAGQSFVRFGMSPCNNFSVGVGESNTAYMSMSGVNAMNFYMNNSNVIPFSMSNASVGIGGVPRFGNALEVNGTIWSRGGLASSLGDRAAPLITNDSGSIILNSNNMFTSGVKLGHRVVMDGRSNNNSWTINTNFSGDTSLVIDPLGQSDSGFYRFNDDGRFFINGSNAGITIRNGNTNLFTEFPNANGSNVISGPTTVNGETTINGNTTVNGSLITNNPIMFSPTNGVSTMLERQVDANGNRYGLGYDNKTLNMYISGVDPAAKLSIGTTTAAGELTERVSMGPNGNVTFAGSANVTGNLNVIGTANIRNSAIRNQAGNTWFSYVDGAYDLMFTPSINGTMPANAATVSMKFTDTGDITAPRDITATRNISGASVTGTTQICSGTKCLSEQDITSLKAILDGTATINANSFCIKSGQCINNVRMNQIATAYP